MSASVMLVAIIVLLTAGLLLRRAILKVLGGRHALRVARREPGLIDHGAGPPPLPLFTRSPALAPAHAETDRRVDEVEDALRTLAGRLRQRRSTLAKANPAEIRVRL